MNIFINTILILTLIFLVGVSTTSCQKKQEGANIEVQVNADNDLDDNVVINRETVNRENVVNETNITNIRNEVREGEPSTVVNRTDINVTPPPAQNLPATFNRNYSGTLNNNNVRMTLRRNNNNLTGSYRTTSGSVNYILSGTIQDDGDYSLKERRSGSNTVTANIDGTFTGNAITGTRVSSDGTDTDNFSLNIVTNPPATTNRTQSARPAVTVNRTVRVSTPTRPSVSVPTPTVRLNSRNEMPTASFDVNNTNNNDQTNP